jgi:ABC-type transport system involved in multi-copper enzyme maturation permease subunit
MLRRMLLTYKQNRFEVVGSLVVTVAVFAGVLYEIAQLNGVAFPAGCSPNIGFGPIAVVPGSDLSASSDFACQNALNEFNAIRYGTLQNLVHLFLFLGPYIVAIMLGAPLVAREVEQGTAPLSWSLIGSRHRWLVARAAAMLALLVPLLVAFGLAGDMLEGASNPGVDPWATFDAYMLRGLPVVSWALVAFALAAMLGTLLGRTMPAIFLSVVGTLFLTVVGFWAIQQYLLRPFDRPLMTWDQLVENMGANWQPDALVIDWQTYLDGKPWDGDVNQWYMTHEPPVYPDPGIAAPTDPGTAAGYVPPIWGPQQLPIGFSGDQYWPVVLGQSAVVVTGAAVLIGLAFYRVDRRRPY